MKILWILIIIATAYWFYKKKIAKQLDKRNDFIIEKYKVFSESK